MSKKTWIQMPEGRRFYPYAAEGPIVLSDIAGALSKINRYTGQSIWPLSVAQHSLNVSRVLPEPLKLWGLLHDAPEAYLNDVASPLKHRWWMRPYRRAEDRIMRRVAEQFGLVWPMPAEVKAADLRMMATEVRVIFNDLHPEWESWVVGVEPYRIPESWLEEDNWAHVKMLFESHAHVLGV